MLLPSRPARTRWRVIGALVAVLTLSVVSACSGGATGSWRSAGGTGGGSSGEPVSPAQISVVPAGNAKNISPVDPVTVTLATGTLDTVTLTNPAGKQVKGELSADKLSWQNGEELGYNKKYTLTIEATGTDGQKVTKTSSFTTVKPNNLTLPYLRANYGTLLKGKTFGVGQPIVVWFDEPIKDKAAAEKQLVVTTDPPVAGSWHWFDNREAHWRPQAYWAAGTKVTVEAKVYGHNLGGGLYGQEDVSASFTIGKSKMLVADAKTHRMKVYVDGKQVTKIAGKDVTAGIPVSLGKDGTTTGSNGETIDFRTYSGVHVMTLKYEEYRMTSASFGITDPKSPNYYDSMIGKAIRISNSGEFVHLRTWSLWQMGKQNTSHGCVNVGEPYISYIFANFGAGDVVDVKNTGKALDVRDGLGDWNMDWDDWVKGSALS